MRCGRRWGKTEFGATIACDSAIKRQSIGWFAPGYKFTAEAYTTIADVLAPIKAPGSSRIDGVIRTITGGRIDVWSLENERAGRSRKYHGVIIDEGAFTKPNMMRIWETSIEPTLLDYGGWALVLSNTNGNDPENFLWQICNEERHGFRQYHAPSWQNPHVPQRKLGEASEDYLARRAAVYAELREKTHPLVFRQEYEAEFVDWSGVAFFALDKLLVEGTTGTEINGKRYQPVDLLAGCDSIFLIIDTAIKGGKDHDGTAVSWWALSSFGPHPLVCLEWELVQVDAALLEQMMPQWLARGEALAGACRARFGFTGGYIEDIAAGSVLLQQCVLRGWPMEACPEKLASAGKNGRAINASGPVYRGDVKIARPAFDHTCEFKGTTRNHMLSQITGFRIGDKAAATRADDLFDNFTYAVGIALGGNEGFA